MKKFNISKLQLFATTPQTGVQQDTVINTTQSENLKSTIKQHWVPTMLDNLRNLRFHVQFGRKEKLPLHKGHFVEFRRWNTIEATDADGNLQELVEGITPDPDEIGQNRVTTEIADFGKWVPITDKLKKEAFDNVILGATEELSATAADQLDLYTRNQLLTGTNVSYASKKTFNDDGKVTSRTAVSNVSQIDTTCILDAYEVHKVINRMAKAKVPKFDGKNYVAIIHHSVEFDLTESKGWKEAHVYSSPEEIFNGEIGRLQGCRFCVTSNAKVYGTNDLSQTVGGSTYKNSTAVYPCLFFGKDAYAVIEPEKGSLEFFIKLAEDSGTEDPLEQRNTVGYKFSTATAILDDNRLWQLRCASSEFGDEDETN